MALISYGHDQSGNDVWQYCINWSDDPSGPNFAALGGYDIVRESADGHRTPDGHVGKGSIGTYHYASPWFPLPANQPASYRVWINAHDQQGNRNTIRLGVTPSIQFTISRPGVGGTGTTPTVGEEYTSLVLNLTASMFYTTLGGTAANAQGHKTLIIQGSVTPPNDPSWGGYIIEAVCPGFPNGNQLTGIVKDSTFTCQITAYPATTQTWTLRARSSDTTNHVNTFVSGITPEYSLVVTPPPLGSSGQEYTSLIEPRPATVIGCTGNGVSPIVITFDQPFDADQFFNGDPVVVQGVLGNTAANGSWPGNVITFPDNQHMSIAGATGNSAYTGGGTVTGPLARVDYELNVDGGENYGFSGAFQPPTADPTFGGVTIYAINFNTGATEVLAVTGPDTNTFHTDMWPIHDSEPKWFIAFASFDKNNQQNSYDVDVTPLVILHPVKQTTGSILLTRVKPSSYNSSTFTGGAGSPLDIATHGVKNNHLDALSVDISKFASGFRPVAIFTSNPALPDANYPPGTYGMNITGTGSLLRVNQSGNAWQSGVTGPDIALNSITVAHAAAGFFSATNITAGTISAAITITAPTINGGTFTGSNLSISGSGFVITLNTASGFTCSGGGTNVFIRNEAFAEGGNGISLQSLSFHQHITPSFIGIYATSGTPLVTIEGTIAGGSITVADSTGTSAIELNTSVGVITFGGRGIYSDGELHAAGDVSAAASGTGVFKIGGVAGKTASFTSADGKTVTVTGGIITSVA